MDLRGTAWVLLKISIPTHLPIIRQFHYKMQKSYISSCKWFFFQHSELLRVWTSPTPIQSGRSTNHQRLKHIINFMISIFNYISL